MSFLDIPLPARKKVAALGGKTSSANLTIEERQARAAKAAEARWGKGRAGGRLPRKPR